jgi:hypothetical protein
MVVGMETPPFLIGEQEGGGETVCWVAGGQVVVSGQVELVVAVLGQGDGG